MARVTNRANTGLGRIDIEDRQRIHVELSRFEHTVPPYLCNGFGVFSGTYVSQAFAHGPRKERPTGQAKSCLGRKIANHRRDTASPPLVMSGNSVPRSASSHEKTFSGRPKFLPRKCLETWPTMRIIMPKAQDTKQPHGIICRADARQGIDKPRFFTLSVIVIVSGPLFVGNFGIERPRFGRRPHLS